MSSFGEELKRERELRQISLREISEATKINLRYLEALERNDFKHLPGGVFNKGFVRAYAQFVGIDPEAMVNAYLLEEQDQERREDASGHELLRRGPAGAIPEVPEAVDAPARSGRGWIVLAALGLALLLLLAWWLWPSGARSVSPSPSTAAGPPPPSVAQEPEPSAAPETEAGTSAPETETHGAGPASPAATPSSASGPAGATAPPTAAPEPEPAAPATGGPVLEARVRLERTTSGRINCDNRRVEILDAMSAGTELRFRCREFLVVDADDGGAVWLGLGGRTPAPLAADGQPLRGYQVDASRSERR